MNFFSLVICWIVTALIIYLSGFMSLFLYDDTIRFFNRIADKILHKKKNKDSDSDFD